MGGQVVQAAWTEADWDTFLAAQADGQPPPRIVFAPNRYPYQVPDFLDREDAHRWQKSAQHWILWYFHYPWDPLNDPGDVQIDTDVRSSLKEKVEAEGLQCADYIWYRNPGMSVPEVFHVQVFFIAQDTRAEM